MGVRTTWDESRVAIYDSVSGFAFGPTFADADDAVSYLDYLNDVTDLDPREQTDRQLEGFLSGWLDACDRLGRSYESGDFDRAEDVDA